MSTRRIYGGTIRSIPRHPAWLGLHGLILVVGIMAIASIPTENRSAFQVGRSAPSTVIAHHALHYQDHNATRTLRRQAAAAVSPVYRGNLAAARAGRSAARALLASIVDVFHQTKTTPAAEQSQIEHLLLRAPLLHFQLPRLGPRQWQRVKARTMSLLASSMDVLEPFTLSGVQRALQVLDSSMPHPSGPVAQAVDVFMKSYIVPTEVVNHKATAAKIQAAEAKVKPVIVPVPAGTVVVRRGEFITPAIYQELRAVGIPQPVVDWTERVAAGLFGLVVFALMLWYLRSFYVEITENQLLMLLLDATVLVTGVAARVLLPGHSLLHYFFPLAGAAALAGLLISSEVGVSLAVVLTLLVSWLVPEPFGLTAFLLLTAVAGALAVRQLQKLNDFLIVGAWVSGVGIFVIAAFHLLNGEPWSLTFLRDYGAAAAFNGLISGALAFGGFVLLGNSFGITTTLHLLELGHPDQKLLRRLMADAPGTYNHSLVVASMVERAAAEIDANSLLARVMALYHDIGKIANPLCFIENQIGTSNIHDDLKPEESAGIIRAHVTHGAVLARQHRLPVPIRDGILQHHGTMTMAYFFHRALETDPNADAAVYTYPGPRPHSKEIALLMLADGCEGAVRATPTKSPETIRDTVDRIVDERVATGQLSQCNLTLRDLAAVRTCFVEVLNGIYHPRIEYPASITPMGRVDSAQP